MPALPLISKLPLASNSLGGVGWAGALGPGGKRPGSPGSPYRSGCAGGESPPFGSSELPANPIASAVINRATFVARGFSGDPKQLTDLIMQGIRHKQLGTGVARERQHVFVEKIVRDDLVQEHVAPRRQLTADL